MNAPSNWSVYSSDPSDRNFIINEELITQSIFLKYVFTFISFIVTLNVWFLEQGYTIKIILAEVNVCSLWFTLMESQRCLVE